MNIDPCEYVAIFQAKWPFQAQSAYTAIELANAGFNVDLFMFESTELFDLAVLENDQRIQIHIFNERDLGETTFWTNSSKTFKAGFKSHVQFLRPIVRKIKDIFHYLEILIKGENGLIPESVIVESIKIMDSKNYLSLIGVEKMGLLWAGKIGTLLNLPFLYSSLELYTRDHPIVSSSLQNKYIKSLEERYHQRAAGTIIQDANRADILLNDNQVSNGNTLFMPVSVKNGPLVDSNHAIRKQFGLGEEDTIILQYGIISQRRFSDALVKAAQSFPPHWKLVMHGWGSVDEINSIKTLDKKQKVVFSLDRLSNQELDSLVAAADIGLVFYNPHPENDRITAFSSEKLAQLLRFSKPIIAFNYPGYEVLQRYKCGVLISNIAELRDAVQKILKHPRTYGENAYRCFEENYEFGKNFQKIIEFIRSVN